MPDEQPTSVDALFGGRITLAQPAKGHGYRANVDAILLAAFAAGSRSAAKLAVDLGSGVGAVGLALWHLGAVNTLVLVDRDEAAASLARRNIDANGLGGRASVLTCDLTQRLSEVAPSLVHRADLVVTNPPYGEPPRTRPPAAPGARHQARHGELAPFLRAMADALGRRARGCLVYPAHALVDVLCTARALGLEPKRMQFVHGKPERPARVVLVEFAHARAGGLVVEPPLIEIGADGKPSPDLDQLLRPDR